MDNTLGKLFLTALAVLLCMGARAQSVVVKTNILSDAVGTGSLGAEAALGRHWSAGLETDFRLFAHHSDHYAKHFAFVPEVRWWNCETFMGTFIGLHAIADKFNYSDDTVYARVLKDTEDGRSQGYAAGAGLSIGHVWLLSRRLSLEAEAGAGAVYSKYDRYELGGYGQRTDKGLTSMYIGPTRLELSLVWCF